MECFMHSLVLRPGLRFLNLQTDRNCTLALAGSISRIARSSTEMLLELCKFFH
jgi:hypothetical protein